MRDSVSMLAAHFFGKTATNSFWVGLTTFAGNTADGQPPFESKPYPKISVKTICHIKSEGVASDWA